MGEGMTGTGWHRRSMESFYDDGLRGLLRRRIGAEGYLCAPAAGDTVDVSLSRDTDRGPLQATWRGLPLPDAAGVFTVGDRRLVVVPVMEAGDLAEGRVLCAGEQLLAFLSERIGGGGAFTDWDRELILGLAPLDRLIAEFLESTGQDLDRTNAYSTLTHLRRILNPHGAGILPGSHAGRACPIDMPENPDLLGKVLTLSRGARIEDGRVKIVSDDPADGLGPVAAMIPFVHHTDPLRAQMGVNRMRQWRAAARPEPALVRTGLEPADPGLWLGCNLLTAFTSRGGDTYEDSLCISASAAARLGFDAETGVGALLSNRNGQRGVVGTVRPDDGMPRLTDGTPVELVVSFIGLHTRMNAGQLLEAAAGWTARRSGAPYVAVPFTDGDRERIAGALPDAPYRQRLRTSGEAEPLSESIVGWVYWGVCAPHASNRLMVPGAIGEGRHLRQGEMETHVLIRRGAYLTIRERFTTLASEETREPGWSVLHGMLKERLNAAGIRMEAAGQGLGFRFAEPEGDALRLEAPLEHPWLPGRAIGAVGRVAGIDGLAELERANRALAEGRALPASLREGRVARLQSLLGGYCAALLTAEDMRMGNRVLRSGRGMISVGTGLACDQAGIPRAMADALFDGAPPEWVIINRAPTMEDTAVVAFHPVVVPGDAIRLPPCVCRWMDADFDGDMVAVLVPGSPETQEEAGRLLSVLGHVRADPGTLDTLAPNQEALWGLARAWLSSEGRWELRAILPSLDGELLTRAALIRALRGIREASGADAAIRKAAELWDAGFAAARASGATLDPFAAAGLPFPAAPVEPDPAAWDLYGEHCIQIVAGARAYDTPAFGAQLLAVHSGARGEERDVTGLLLGDGLVEDGPGRWRIVARGFLHGMDFPSYLSHARRDHERMAESASWWRESRHPGFPDYRPYRPEGRHVIARAMRSGHPGIVFARAAATGETDPLEDDDTRLFVGLLPRE